MLARRSMLIVEDCQHDLELMLNALKRLDLPHAIDIARDGAEAIEYLARAAQTMTCPAVAFFDVKLPRASGHDVLRFTRGQRQFCQMPIVMMSASSIDTDVQQAYDLGANAYVIKPMSFRAFLTVVEDTVAFWLGRNLPPPCAEPA